MPDPPPRYPPPTDEELADRFWKELVVSFSDVPDDWDDADRLADYEIDLFLAEREAWVRTMVWAARVEGGEYLYMSDADLIDSVRREVYHLPGETIRERFRRRQLEMRTSPTDRHFVFRTPTRVPDGKWLVHNHHPPTRLNASLFKAWLCDPDPERYEVCPCQWKPKLGLHYRVNFAAVRESALRRLDDD